METQVRLAAEQRARTVAVPSATATPAEVEGDGDETLTEAQLQAALLTVADLPTGYTAVPADEEDDEEETTGENAECSERFERLSNAEDEEAASASADVEGGFGVVLEQGLESYEDEDTVTQRFDDVVDVLSDCPTFTTTDEAGQTTEISIKALSFPKLGDDTVALAVTGTSRNSTSASTSPSCGLAATSCPSAKEASPRTPRSSRRPHAPAWRSSRPPVSESAVEGRLVAREDAT